MASVLVAAILPVLVLSGFILHKDRAQPEPPLQLLRAFGAGAFSVIPALGLIALFRQMELAPSATQTAWGAVFIAFRDAAIPEEMAKLLMLWMVLRRNPYFDERMDGIVYAVCVSLGFAAVENTMYLFADAGNLVQTGIMRAVFAVPGHFCDGVLMGYYYSLARFCRRARGRHAILTLVAPVLAHGVYDSFLYAAGVSELVRGSLCLLFPLFSYLLWRYATRRINEHLRADGVRFR